MTQSRMENLLQQMALRNPSAELDDRVLDQITSGNTKAAPITNALQHRSWGLLTTVAIACLTVGLVAGYSLAGATPVEANGNAASSVDETTVVETIEETTSDRPFEVIVESNANSDRLIEEQGVHSAIAAAVKNRMAQIEPELLRGPNVSIVCASKHTTNSHEMKGKCLTCHSGIASAESAFRTTHTTHPSFATCMWCHITEESMAPLR